jgi:hypothetical protein
VVDSYEHGNEPSVSMNGGIFPQLSDYQPPKRDTVLWS